MAMLEVVLLLVMTSVVEGRGSCYEVTRYNLRNVICTDKQLTTVPPDLDSDVKVMYLDRNKLTQLTGDTFLPYVALQELYLENNDISSIAEDTFAPVTNLQTLNLESNSLTSLPVPALRHLGSLRKLFLKNNAIGYIGEGDLNALTRLEELDLEKCQLTSIEPTALSRLTSLQTLNLVSNQLSALPATMERHLPASLSVLRLHGNPWACDCKLRWLRQWIDWRKSLNWDFINTPQCHSPPILRDLKWKELPAHKFACASKIRNANRTTFTLTVGATLTLECSASGDPLPSVTWQRGHALVTETDRLTIRNVTTHVINDLETYTRSIVTIVQAQQSDAGDYRCVAENNVGRSEMTFSVWEEGKQGQAVVPAGPSIVDSQGSSQQELLLGGVLGAALLVLLLISAIVCLLAWNRGKTRSASRRTTSSHAGQGHVIQNEPNEMTRLREDNELNDVRMANNRQQQQQQLEKRNGSQPPCDVTVTATGLVKVNRSSQPHRPGSGEVTGASPVVHVSQRADGYMKLATHEDSVPPRNGATKRNSANSEQLPSVVIISNNSIPEASRLTTNVSYQPPPAADKNDVIASLCQMDRDDSLPENSNVGQGQAAAVEGVETYTSDLNHSSVGKAVNASSQQAESRVIEGREAVDGLGGQATEQHPVANSNGDNRPHHQALNTLDSVLNSSLLQENSRLNSDFEKYRTLPGRPSRDYQSRPAPSPQPRPHGTTQVTPLLSSDSSVDSITNYNGIRMGEGRFQSVADQWDNVFGTVRRADHRRPQAGGVVTGGAGSQKPVRRLFSEDGGASLDEILSSPFSGHRRTLSQPPVDGQATSEEGAESGRATPSRACAQLVAELQVFSMNDADDIGTVV